MSLFSRVDLKSFAAANNEFAVGAYKELREREGNLFFSFYAREVSANADCNCSHDEPE